MYSVCTAVLCWGARFSFARRPCCVQCVSPMRDGHVHVRVAGPRKRGRRLRLACVGTGRR
eukprot:4266163-Prymnesium_polylepis.1